MSAGPIPSSTAHDPAYLALRSAFSTQAKPIVVFAGAGLSAPSMPTWRELKDDLVDALRNKAATLPSPTDAGKLAEEADRIGRLKDFWLAFKLLRDSLGQASFTAEIRGRLAASSSIEVPPLYCSAWELPIQGMLTLNLDSFMVRAFSQAHPGRELKRFTGRAAASLGNILHGQHAFALNMHGIMDDVDSWVFTNDDLRSLTRTASYKLLMSKLLTDYTILFIGITVDDLAVGGFLESLTSQGIQHDAHYWLTDRSGLDVDAWAESSGIRIIRYRPTNGHEAALGAIFDDLASYVAPEIEAAPVVLSSYSIDRDALPPPDVLVTYPLTKIRELLNARAAELLADDGDEGGWSAFEELSTEYIEAVHRAWFTTDKPPNNTLFGYTLHEKIAQGAFGRVYRGVDADGRDVAVKVLLDDIREDMELRKSFRRGVSAMRILEQANVDGMVAYREASEIPAFVSMDWISGPNLMEAKRDALLNSWDAVLPVIRDLAVIIRRAHQLPQAVLHRDIRPANVMLRDGYLGQADWSVAVLDFDLSTYRGASEKSVIASASALGYLAPEQLESRPKESTRNANVDSFGIGMTLLYLCSGREPQAFMHLYADYGESIKHAVRSLGGTSWQSLPERVARLVQCTTRDRQAERWDVPQIIRELDRLILADQDPSSVTDADMVAEELAARALGAYSWHEDTEEAEALATSLSTTIAGDSATGRLELRISWSSSGDEKWSKLAKFLAARVPRALAILSSGPWNAERLPGGAHDFALRATCHVRTVVGHLDSVAKTMSDAIAVFNFEAV